MAGNPGGSGELKTIIMASHTTTVIALTTVVVAQHHCLCPIFLYIYIIVAVAVFNNKFNNLQGTLRPSLGHEAGQGLGLRLEFW
jgi:hypothetical protein